MDIFHITTGHKGAEISHQTLLAPTGWVIQLVLPFSLLSLSLSHFVNKHIQKLKQALGQILNYPVPTNTQIPAEQLSELMSPADSLPEHGCTLY